MAVSPVYRLSRERRLGQRVRRYSYALVGRSGSGFPRHGHLGAVGFGSADRTPEEDDAIMHVTF